jgi:MHS family alpha-ketoglutarate permease-like MFS transporter
MVFGGRAVSGGTVPYLYTWLSSMGLGWMFSLYIVVLAVATLVAIRFIPETAGIEMNKVPLPGEDASSDEAKPVDNDATVALVR